MSKTSMQLLLLPCSPDAFTGLLDRSTDGDRPKHAHTTHNHARGLQEVDHYHDCLAPRMAALGYRGAFMQKPLNQDGGWWSVQHWGRGRPGD